MKTFTKKLILELIGSKKKNYTKQSIQKIVDSIMDEYVYDTKGVYKTQISKFGRTVYQNYIRPLKADANGNYTLSTSMSGSEWRIQLKFNPNK